MKKTIFAILALSAAVAGMAEQRPPTQEEVEKMTPQERKAAIMAIALRKYGGPTAKPGTGEGVIRIVNAQSDIPAGGIAPLVSAFVNRFHYDVEVTNGAPVTVGTATQRLSEIKANAAVFVVSDKALPRVLVSPEDGWAIVNAGALSGGAKDGVELEARLGKEVIRGLCFIGGLGQAAGMPIMHPVNYAVDLDSIANAIVMGDAAKRFALVMPSFGLQPKVVKNYRNAVQEGWAPAPTNEIQKAIWDEVHKLPTEPIKIEPETKKVKE